MWPHQAQLHLQAQAQVKPIKRLNYNINDEEDSKGPPIKWSQIQWASHILYMGQRDHKDLKKCM